MLHTMRGAIAGLIGGLLIGGGAAAVATTSSSDPGVNPCQQTFNTTLAGQYAYQGYHLGYENAWEVPSWSTLNSEQHNRWKNSAVNAMHSLCVGTP